MTATLVERINKFAGEFPHRGTMASAANMLHLKNTFVCKDSAGRAANVAAGLPVYGVAEATFLNRTTDPSGGAADAIDVEVAFGVWGFLLSGTAPTPGQVVYAADNQTVSIDPSPSRGVAGICSEVRVENGVTVVYVFVGPVALALAVGSIAVVDVPLTGFRLATGAAVPAFGAGTADGYTLADSEALCLRINDDSTTVLWTSVRLPESMPAGAPVVLHVSASRIGATNTAVELLTPSVFANREGVAYDAGAALTTGNFAIMPGATKVVQELTKAITGAQAGDVLSLSLVAAAGLADDDLAIHAVWVTCG